MTGPTIFRSNAMLFVFGKDVAVSAVDIGARIGLVPIRSATQGDVGKDGKKTEHTNWCFSAKEQVSTDGFDESVLEQLLRAFKGRTEALRLLREAGLRVRVKVTMDCELHDAEMDVTVVRMDREFLSWLTSMDASVAVDIVCSRRTTE